MLAYALGREVQGDDECAVREIQGDLDRDGHRFSALVLGVARSVPFQYRRNLDGREPDPETRHDDQARASPCPAAPSSEGPAPSWPCPTWRRWPPAGPLAPRPGRPPLRLGIVSVTGGTVLESWRPKEVGPLGKLPSILRPLEPFKDDLLVLSGLAHSGDSEGLNGHEHCAFLHLTGAAKSVKKVDGKIQAGVSVDQAAARATADQTYLPSLELGLNNNQYSFRSPDTYVPYEANPRLVFERMFRGRTPVVPNWSRRGPARAEADPGVGRARVARPRGDRPGARRGQVPPPRPRPGRPPQARRVPALGRVDREAGLVPRSPPGVRRRSTPPTPAPRRSSCRRTSRPRACRSGRSPSRSSATPSGTASTSP